MADNQYTLIPTRIGVMSPTGTISTIWLAGKVSATTCKALGAHVRTSAMEAILKKKYGNSWKKLCAPCTDFNVKGGSLLDELIFEPEELSLQNVPDISTLSTAAAQQVDVSANKIEKQTESSLRVSNLTLYTEDSLTEVREKIFLATEIPPFRQHLAWRANESAELESTYKLYVNEDQIFVDPKQLCTPDQSVVLGLSINELLINNRKELIIESYDNELQVNALPLDSRGGITFWLFDLEKWINPIRSQIVGTTEEIIRYGFVTMFWPQIGQAWSTYLHNPKEISTEYPTLWPSATTLSIKYTAEAEAMDLELDKIEEYMEAEETHVQLFIGIRSTVLSINSGANTCKLFALFESFQLSEYVPAIRLWLHAENLVVVRTFGHSDRKTPWPAEFNSSGVTFAIRVNTSDTKLSDIPDTTSFRFRTTIEVEQSRYIFIHIDVEALIRVRLTFGQGAGVGFDKLHHFAAMNTDSFFKSLMQYSSSAFSPKFDNEFVSTSNSIKLIENRLKLLLLSATLRWPGTITDKIFQQFRSAINNLAIAGIISIEDNVHSHDLHKRNSSEFEFIQLKGIVESVSTRVLEAEYGSGYAGLTNVSAKALAERSMTCVRVKVTNRISDIALTLSQINEITFLSVYSEMLVLFHTLANKGIFHESIGVEQHGRQRLRRLQLLDPVRFNLKIHGSQFVYSRLCQTGQPAGLNLQEFKRLSATQQHLYTPMHNYTTNTISYYKCPNAKLPYLTFITGKHPLGYCLPCCAKSLPTLDTPREIAYKQCLQEPNAVLQKINIDTLDRRHIVAFNRDIVIGRAAILPSILTTLFFDTLDVEAGNVLCAIGVSQNVFDNYGGNAWSVLAYNLQYSLKELFMYVAKVLAGDRMLYLSADGGILSQVFSQDDIVSLLRSKSSSYTAADRQRIVEYDRWDELALDLAGPLFKVHYVLFAEEAHRKVNSSISSDKILLNDSVKTDFNEMFCWSSKTTSTALAHHTEQFGTFPLLFGIRHPEGNIYPIVEINENKYLQTGLPVLTKFAASHTISALIKNLFTANRLVRRAEELPTPPSAETISEFLNSPKAHLWKISAVYVTRKSLAYGIVLHKNNDHVWVPLVNSSLFDVSTYLPKAKIQQGTFMLDEWKLSSITLSKWMTDYNNFSETIVSSKIPGSLTPLKYKPYACITGLLAVYSPPSADLEIKQLSLIGVCDAVYRGVYWLNWPLNTTTTSTLPVMPIPWRGRITLGAHPDAISRAISLNDFSYAGPSEKAIVADARVAEFRSYAYPLLAAAVTRWLSHQRNAPLRDLLNKALQTANRPQKASTEILKILKKYQEDKNTQHDVLAYQLDETILRSLLQDAKGANWKITISKEILNRSFYFDMEPFLNADGACTIVKAVTQEDEHVNERVRAEGNISPYIAPPCELNMADNVPYCSHGKLAFPLSWITELKTMLSNEFAIPGRALSFLTIAPLISHADIKLQPRFTHHAGEYVLVYTEQFWLHGDPTSK